MPLQRKGAFLVGVARSREGLVLGGAAGGGAGGAAELEVSGPTREPFWPEISDVVAAGAAHRCAVGGQARNEEVFTSKYPEL